MSATRELEIDKSCFWEPQTGHVIVLESMSVDIGLTD